MVSCPICNRDFKSSNSMRSHRSRFHDAGPEKDINIQNSSNESDESNDEHVYRYNIDNGTNITNEEEETMDNSEHDGCIDFNHDVLINHPKFLKMICKGILDKSIPITDEQRLRLQSYADDIREIARIRIHRLNVNRELLQLLMNTLQECITAFEY